MLRIGLQTELTHYSLGDICKWKVLCYVETDGLLSTEGG
jgi:hypothetical protein